MTIDATSPTWRAVEKKASEVIEAARRVIEAASVDQRVADYHRGRIAAWREVLDLTKAPVVIEDTDPEY